jgi:DNA repair ATPase RecN|tara:strand:- start:22 stop:231 length:210 start_codon:yes stop_codon:yes gene_type:complete
MAEKKKATKKVSDSNAKVEEALTHVLESLNNIEERLDSLEESSHEPMDFNDDIDAIDSRLFKVEGRMGL